MPRSELPAAAADAAIVSSVFHTMTDCSGLSFELFAAQQSAEVAAQNQQFLSFGDFGRGNFGEFCSERPRGQMTSEDHAFGTEFAYGEFDKSGGGVEAGSFDRHIWKMPHSANALFPFTAGMGADEVLFGVA